MKTLLFLSSAIALALAFGPPLDLKIAKDEKAAVSFKYAVDLSGPTSPGIMDCLYKNAYHTAFVRIYKPDGNGQVDQEAIKSIRNANSVRMGVEIYHTPAIQSNKPGAEQFTDVYNVLKNAGIFMRSIWLQVTSPNTWGSNQAYNIHFVSSFISEAHKHNVTVGIYTNWYDWSQITGSWSGWTAAQQIQLWYWNTNGLGPQAESSADFGDFRPFGGWNQATIKQFGLQSTSCGVNFNRNTYTSATPTVRYPLQRKRKEIAVGTTFLKNYYL
ncbi:hypothetical protein L596_024522 [Steinernema carpocapsae]|uniref:Lysozyme n=1 Tax=Steinernema carpocapsae TaxID=34508 RepID=A0A4U5MH10_STECR|nr:hypothetical protein L596_024522 [Steinernema carpocapsae]